MPKYERIKLHISDISPKSAEKVFAFLDRLYDNNLEKDFFIKESKKYTVDEQFFICHYAKIYFSESHNNFLNNEIDRLYHIYGTMAVNDVTTLKLNAVSLLKYIDDTQFKFLKRKVQLAKKIQYTEAKINSYKPKIATLKFRIPLYSWRQKVKYEDNPELVASFYSKDEIEYALHTGAEMSITAPSTYYEDFKYFFFETFDKILDYEQISSLFLNSFRFSENTTNIELLNLEIDNSATLYDAFFKVYKKYNEIQLELYSHIEEQKKAVKDFKTARKKLTSKVKINYATKKDFMKVMYNSFSQIRDSYASFKIKNPNITLEQYLTTKSRNIK